MTTSLRNSGILCTLARACTLAILLFIPAECIFAATLPQPFIFFNNTRFSNRTILDTDGLMRSSVVYDVWNMSCSATTCTNIPADSTFLSTMKYYVSNDSVAGGYGSSFLIVLDFEHLALGSATSQGQANNEVAVMLHFAQLVRQTFPSALVGAYDYDYTANSSTYRSTRAQLFAPGGFNVFVPTLYQRWSTHAQWNTYLNAAIANDSAINATLSSPLPIYPYISPYVSGNVSSGFLSSEEWQAELSDLINFTPPAGVTSTPGGAVVWTGPATISTTDSWYTDLLSVLSPVIDPTQTYYLTNEHNGLCPTLEGSTDGSAIDQMTCDPSGIGSQQWNFQTTSNGKFYMNNTGSPTQYLTVQGASTVAGALLEGDSAPTSKTSSQTWHVVSAGKRYYSKGYYVLIGDASSKCVEAPAGGAGAQLDDNVCSTTTQQLYAIHPRVTPTVTATGNTCTYAASGCSGTGSATGLNGVALTPVSLSYSGTGYGPTPTPPVTAGTYAVTASFAGNLDYTPATSSPASIVITPAPTALAAFAVNPNPQQYSDLISISAAPASTTAIGGSLNFYINYGTSTQHQLGATQVIGPGGTGSISNFALLESVAGEFNPGTHNVTAVFAPADSVDFTGTTDTVAFNITMEDANLTYTGQYLLYTSSPSTYSVTAPLTFTIQDSNAVPNTSPIYDSSPGDIRNARYNILVDGVATPACSNLQPALVNTDTRVGTIGCNYTFSFPSSQTGITPTITVVPATSSYYAATTGDTSFPLSVNLPAQTNFITGGGFVVNTASAGTFAGDTGANTNFGFNVKYNKGGTNLQGNASIVVRSHGHIYQIKANSMSSLGVTGTTQGGYGAFIAKANIQDVTDPSNPISIEGNDSLTLSFHDNGTPGTNDTISIAVYNGGILRFASSWDGMNVIEQPLAGGNLAAH